MMVATWVVRSLMPSSEGFFSTLSMAWCRDAITLTQSHTHSNTLLCSGGSRFATTPSTRAFLPGLARPVGSNVRISFSGFSIYGRSQICYCYVDNINFGTSFFLFVSLAAFIIKIRRDMLPATSWSWVWTIFPLASLGRFEVQNSHMDSSVSH
jgi:hypothetical protein